MFVPSLDNVQSVYCGRVNTCCCGCAGKHSYPSSFAGQGKAILGYDFDDSDLSDRAVKTVFNKVFGGKYGPAKRNSVIDDSIYYVDTKTRTYIVYFK